MSAEWPIVRLGEYIDSSLGKMLDQKKNKGTPHPYLGNSNVRWGYFDLSDLSEMRFEDSEHKRYGIKKGDLIVCEGGEPGRCAIWDEEIPNMKIQKALHRIRTLPGLNSEYLYLCFLHWGKTRALDPYFTGTTIKHLTGRALAEIPLALPPEDYQLWCANIIMGLEKKINLNTQINQTLESIAQAIFKSWFVDFEPVKAKMAAKERWYAMQPTSEPASPVCYADEAALPDLETYTNLAAMCAISGKNETELAQLQQQNPDHYQQLAETAALFPSAMVDSELGETPEGWEVKSISDIARFAAGKVEVSELTVQNYISTENMLANRGGIDYATSLPSVSTVPNFKKGQTLISNIRPYFKKIWLARFDGGRSNDVLCLEAKEKDSEEFLYNLLYQDDFFEFMMRTSKGAKMPRGDKEAIAGWSFPCPNQMLMITFSEKVFPFYSYIESVNAESMHLSGLRDSLLPKLLSGEIPLKDYPQPKINHI